MLLREVNDIICFDVWMMIIELDPEVFCKIRLINRKVRKYTNEHIDKYMKMFLRPFKSPSYSMSEERWFRLFEWPRPLRESHSILPNGNKHGACFCQSDHFKIFSNYKNGELDGEYKKLNLSGSVIKLCNYKNGKLEGEYKEFSSDGSLIKLCNYKNGELEGECKKFDSDGSLEVFNCQNGQLEGEYKKFDQLGSLIKLCNYKCGVPDGKYISYKDNYMLMIICNYKKPVHGCILSLTSTCIICNYKNGRLDGEFSEYYGDHLRKKIYYKCGVRHGKYMDYRPDGALSSICNYKNGVLDGPYCTFDNNGIPCESAYYKNGVAIKPIPIYFREYMRMAKNKIPAVKFQHKKIYPDFKDFKSSGKYKRSCR